MSISPLDTPTTPTEESDAAVLRDAHAVEPLPDDSSDRSPWDLANVDFSWLSDILVEADLYHLLARKAVRL